MSRVLTPIPNAANDPAYQLRAGYKRHLVGVDLGVRLDNTSISVIEDSVTPLPEFEKGVQLLGQRKCVCVQSYRLPLGISYTDVLDHLKKLMADPALDEPRMYIDISRELSVSAVLHERKVKHTPVKITAGSVISENEDGVRVAKTYLVQSLASGLQTGELLLSNAVQDCDELMRQLVEFQVQTSATGQQTFGSTQTGHDDCVLSLAMAWLAVKQAPTFTFSVSRLSWR